MVEANVTDLIKKQNLPVNIERRNKLYNELFILIRDHLTAIRTNDNCSC